MKLTIYRQRRAGFATIVALMLVALVAAAIAAVTSLAAADFRRTSNEWRDAQLRQLILAGTIEARAPVAAGAPGDSKYQLSLPAELAGLGGQVDVLISPAGAAKQATITARLGAGRMSQSVDVRR